MKKPTPGPWAVEPVDFTRTTYTKAWLVNADQPIILHEESGQSEANAHLIAAAPELLEACEAASDMLGRADPSNERCHRAKALLDKAIRKAKAD